MPKQNKLDSMFSEISSTYRLLNTLLSMGIDRRWRRLFINRISEAKNSTVIDLSTGTGDIPELLLRKGFTNITGIDPSEKMLEIAEKRIKKLNAYCNINLIMAHAENIPIDNNYADVVTVVFGIRNFNNLQKGFQEINRILKNNSSVRIMEFSMPENKLICFFYKVYLNFLLPLIGGTISGNFKAYRYLSQSIISFSSKCDVVNELSESGFTGINKQSLSMGVVTIYTAFKKTSD